MIHSFSFYRCLVAESASKRKEVNRLVFHPGLLFVLFDLARVALGAVVVVALFYLLIKLAGLAAAMTEAKRASTRSATSQTQHGSVTA
jgi:hypothetical protein